MSHQLAASPMDTAPFLTKKIVDYHFSNGLVPIVIYPETMLIAKFLAPFRVRYILNYSDFLFKNDSLEHDNYTLTYSKNIAKKLITANPLKTIFLPVSDPIFYHPPQNENRIGGVFYADKYRYHFSGKTFPITEGMLEITRNRTDSQTPEEIRTLFQTSEFFYCYEDSALALEAILCGCPAVFIPNDYFHEDLGGGELKGLGYAWGDSPEQLAHAKATVFAARERYFELIEEVNKPLKDFIEETQSLVKGVEYRVSFASNYMRDPSIIQIALSYIRFSCEMIEDKGLKKVISIIFKRLRARRFKVS